MKIQKAITATLAAAMALTSAQAFADAKDDYIKTFGMMIFQRNGLAELQLTEAEFDMLVKGMDEVRKGADLPENIQQIAGEMLNYLGKRAEANVKKEAEKSEAEAADFWKELEKNDKVTRTPTGLAYEIMVAGDAAKMPTENSDVVVNYTGKLVNGTVFDSTEKYGKPAPFNLSKVIPGFREGLQKLGKGGKIRLYIPAKLAYGNNPVPGIPVNSTLIFDIELLEVDPNGAPAAQPAPQSAAPAPMAEQAK